MGAILDGVATVERLAVARNGLRPRCPGVRRRLAAEAPVQGLRPGRGRGSIPGQLGVLYLPRIHPAPAPVGVLRAPLTRRTLVSDPPQAGHVRPRRGRMPVFGRLAKPTIRPV